MPMSNKGYCFRLLFAPVFSSLPFVLYKRFNYVLFMRPSFFPNHDNRYLTNERVYKGGKLINIPASVRRTRLFRLS